MEDGHFIDDPLVVASIKPDFSGLGLSKKIENAIIIGGTVYELVDDNEGDECTRCALRPCNNCNEPLCVLVFGDTTNKRFKEIK